MIFAVPVADGKEDDASNSGAPAEAHERKSNTVSIPTQAIEQFAETSAAHTSDFREPRLFVTDPRGYVAVVHEIAAPFEATRVLLNATVRRVFWKTGRVEVLLDLSRPPFYATLFQCNF